MTDKLKCPFCGAELEKEMAGDIETGRLVCCTKNCPVIDQNLFPDVWELLTAGKKAQEALARAISWLETISIVEMGCATSNTAAKEALDEITQITKQGE